MDFFLNMYTYIYIIEICGSQLDKLRFFLATTDPMQVNSLGIDNCKSIMHMCVFVYFVGNNVTTTTKISC